MGERLIRYEELGPLKGITGTRQTIWKRVKRNEFPKPVKHGAFNAWLESELDGYIAGLVARRDEIQRKAEQDATESSRNTVRSPAPGFGDPDGRRHGARRKVPKPEADTPSASAKSTSDA